MVDVGILGATGAVGQRLVQLLDPHPEFDIATLTASPASTGKTYREAAKWRADTPMPDAVTDIEVVATDPDSISDDVRLLFSSLPSDVGREVEPKLAEAGYVGWEREPFEVWRGPHFEEPALIVGSVLDSVDEIPRSLVDNCKVIGGARGDD